jgi:hypothetical protein
MTDPIKEAAAEIRRRIEDKVAELRATPAMTEVMTLHPSLNALEDVLREPRTSLAEFFGDFFGSSLPGTVGVSRPVSPAVKFDEFYGMSDLPAAKAYLKKRSDARPFDEIVAAIRSGGGKVESEEKLRTGLSRSTLDIVKIGDRYGHIDSYPDEKAKRLKGFRKTTVADVEKDEAATRESGTES